jgi:kumamolisin
MNGQTDTVILRGSERRRLPGTRIVGPADAAARVEVSVLMRSRFSSGRSAHVAALGTRPLDRRSYITREEFEAIHGAGPNDIAHVEAFAQRHHLDVVAADAARRTIVLSGTVGDLAAAFGVELAMWSSGDLTYRGRTGPISIPAELAPVVQGVFGLDDRPQVLAHLRPATRAVESASSAVRIGQLYGFPSELDGNGETIAVIEFGGGFRSSDLAEYFHSQRLPIPAVSAVSVDGAHNSPGHDAGGPDAEVMLDIEVAGALATGAKIVVYFAPNTDRGFVAAATTAIHDRSHRPSILSISWGAAESAWTAQAMRAVDEAFQAAAMLGVTVLAAAGDDGSRDNIDDDLAHVDFPASSPHVLACGGTRLESQGGEVISETAWGGRDGATGGGISDVFRLPTWQDGENVPQSVNPGHRVGRGVPDVAGNADPTTGYRVIVDGRAGTLGGTSAVAPLWAALIARLNQQLGRQSGYLNPLLYEARNRAELFRDITRGSNGAYSARAGWDACTGLGSPHAGALISSLSAPSPSHQDELDPLAFSLAFDAEEGGGGHHPTKHPTKHPTAHPTHHPTKHPTARPTHHPTAHPTHHPTAHPTGHPTARPTGHPTAHPTHQPTAHPTHQPTHGIPTGTPPTGWPPTGTPLPSGWPTGWPPPTEPPPTGVPPTGTPTGVPPTEPPPTGVPPTGTPTGVPPTGTPSAGPPGWPTGWPPPSGWPTGWPPPSEWPTGWPPPATWPTTGPPLPTAQPPGVPPCPPGPPPCPPGVWPCCGSPGSAGLASVAAGLSAAAAVASGIAAGGSGAGR